MSYLLMLVDSIFFVRELEQCFGLHELYVAEQLFQSSEHAADDLFWLAHSLYPSAKVLQAVSFFPDVSYAVFPLFMLSLFSSLFSFQLQ